MKPEYLIRKYIDGNYVMQLATINSGNPQLCTVHYAFDDNLNLYWSSHRFRHHSENVRNNSKTAVGILENVDLKQCVHIEGDSYELTDDEAASAHEIYCARFGQEPEKLNEAESHDKKAHAYYIFRPSLFVLFDADNFPKVPRIEYKPTP
jgi:uncharacterized protein YhbP (UPF0306 family)